MNKIIPVFLISLVCISMFSLIGVAQTTTSDVPVVEPEVAPGLTPDSIFYFLDKWLDNQKILRATSSVEKARLRIEIAEERVAEMRAMLLLGKTAEAKEAQEDEEAHIEELETDLDDIDEELEKELEIETEAEEEKTKVKLEIQAKLQKHILVLIRVQGQVPEQAQQGIDTALENAQKRFDALQQQIPEDERKTVKEIRTEIRENGVRIRERIEVKEGKIKFELKVKEDKSGPSEKSGKSEDKGDSDSNGHGDGEGGNGHGGNGGGSGSGSGSSGSGSGGGSGGNGGD